MSNVSKESGKICEGGENSQFEPMIRQTRTGESSKPPKRTVLSVAISTSHATFFTVRILSLMLGALMMAKMQNARSTGFERLGLSQSLFSLCFSLGDAATGTLISRPLPVSPVSSLDGGLVHHVRTGGWQSHIHSRVSLPTTI